MRRNILLGLVSLLFVGSTAFAETYYVSLKGDDGNDGTSEAAAFRTIRKGVSKLRAGDTVTIGSGDYGNEQIALDASGREGAPIVIKAEQPGEVVLRGEGKGRGLSIVDVSYVVVEGLKFTRYGSAMYIRRSSHITVRRCIFEDNEGAGIELNDGNPGELKLSHDHLFTENQFIDHANTQDYGVQMYFSSNVQVLNNYFYGMHHQACSFKEIVNDSRAANNVFDGFLYSAIYVGQNDDMKDYSTHCHRITVEGNIFRATKKYRAKRAICIANVDDAIVRNNFVDSVYGGDGEGCIAVHPVSNGTKIYGNVILNENGQEQPALYIEADCEVYNNTFAGCKFALEIVKGTAPVVRNNLFYRNNRQVKLSEAPAYEVGSEHKFRRFDDGTVWVWRPDPAKEPVFEHNCWFPRWDGMGKTDLSVDPKFVGALAPYELGGYNPKFVPEFTRAYACRLSKGSPCIDRGVDVGLPFVGTAPDLGAFEFGAEVELEEGMAPGSVPDSSTLYPNRPNPFNPDTEIAYVLLASGWVRLAVYDLLGREVVTVSKGERGRRLLPCPLGWTGWFGGRGGQWCLPLAVCPHVPAYLQAHRVCVQRSCGYRVHHRDGIHCSRRTRRAEGEAVYSALFGADLAAQAERERDRQVVVDG